MRWLTSGNARKRRGKLLTSDIMFAQWNETETKPFRNCFETVSELFRNCFRLFRFTFTSLCGQFTDVACARFLSDLQLIDLQLPNRTTTTDAGLEFISRKCLRDLVNIAITIVIIMISLTSGNDREGTVLCREFRCWCNASTLSCYVTACWVLGLMLCTQFCTSQFLNSLGNTFTEGKIAKIIIIEWFICIGLHTCSAKCCKKGTHAESVHMYRYTFVVKCSDMNCVGACAL